jgi:hypothetical protein
MAMSASAPRCSRPFRFMAGNIPSLHSLCREARDLSQRRPEIEQAHIAHLAAEQPTIGSCRAVVIVQARCQNRIRADHDPGLLECELKISLRD